MTEPIRIGIIGCGKIATVDHVPGYQSIKGVRIVSLLDVKERQVEALRKARDLNAKGYMDPEAFLASGLDAVSICTPNNLHCRQTIAALKAGLHVLCEKPMAASAADATRMIETARKAGRILQINQTFHYLPEYIKIVGLVARGAIGRPIHVRCIRSGGTTPDKGWSPGARWFVSKASDGGVILDIGVHMAEMMQWVGGDVAEIAACVDTRTPDIDVPDNASALMRFKNGATGVLELSWTTPVGAGHLEIYGTRGTLRVGFSAEHPIELIQPGPKGKPDRVSHPSPAGRVKHSQQRFIDAILGRSPSPTPGELGRRAVALCEAIARAGETGKFVAVKQF